MRWPLRVDVGHQIAEVYIYPLLGAQIEQSLYHTDEPYTHDYPIIVSLMPDGRGVKFEDGSIERVINAIILYTGYACFFLHLVAIDLAIKDEGRSSTGMVWSPRFGAKCEIGEKVLLVSEELAPRVRRRSIP